MHKAITVTLGLVGILLVSAVSLTIGREIGTMEAESRSIGESNRREERIDDVRVELKSSISELNKMLDNRDLKIIKLKDELDTYKMVLDTTSSELKDSRVVEDELLIMVKDRDARIVDLESRTGVKDRLLNKGSNLMSK